MRRDIGPRRLLTARYPHSIAPRNLSHEIITKLLLSFVFAVVFAVSGVVCQSSQTSFQNAARPFNMLVLGDSVLWGEGLKPEHKSWYQVKLWIAKTTGRLAIDRIETQSEAGMEAVRT